MEAEMSLLMANQTLVGREQFVFLLVVMLPFSFFLTRHHLENSSMTLSWELGAQHMLVIRSFSVLHADT